MLSWSQAITTIVVAVLGMISSAQITWPTAILEVFRSADTPLARTATGIELSLVGSLSSVGSVIGVPAYAYLFDRVGRKKTAIFSGVPLLLAWTAIAYTSSIEIVLVALLLSGTSMGGFVISLVFVAEISSPDVRGALTTFPVVGYSLGVLLSYVLGGYLPYRTGIYVHLTISVVYLIVVQFVRESPIFLLRRKDEKGALTALAAYRGLCKRDKRVLDEFYELKITTVAETSRELNTMEAEIPMCPEVDKLKTQDLISSSPWSAWKILVHSRPVQRALGLCLTLTMASFFMGIMAVLVYAEYLFSMAAPSIPSVVCCILLALSMLLSSIVSAAVSDRLGRKPLMIGSSALSGVCLLMLASQLQADWAPGWLSVAVILVYMFVYNIGAGIVPFVLVGEVFMPEVRALCSTIALEVGFLSNFVMLFLFEPLVRSWTLHGLFYAYAAVCWLTALFVLWAMPETKGLTPREIQPFFSGRREEICGKKILG